MMVVDNFVPWPADQIVRIAARLGRSKKFTEGPQRVAMKRFT